MSRRALHVTVVSILSLCVLVAMAGPVVADDHYEDATVELDGEEDGVIVLDAEANQTVSGETTLEPGTSISVFVEADDEDHPVVELKPATVQDDGTFEVTIFDKVVPDLDENEVLEGKIEVRVSGDSGSHTIADAEMIVSKGAEIPTATETATETQTDDAGSEATPGFDILVALAALAGGLLLVRRR